jgi:hypothetical protein
VQRNSLLLISQGDRCPNQVERPTWSLEASMPMFSAIARTTVGPAPVNSPAAPSSFTILRTEYRDLRV